MPYPSRPHLAPLPEFAATAERTRFLDPALREQLKTYMVPAYKQGRSLREIGDRSQTAVRRVLHAHEVPLRPAGAAGTGARRRPQRT